MAYSKTNWENAPSTNTPINAGNLNKIEEGIYQNSLKADQVGDLSELETVDKTNLVSAINNGIINYVENEEIVLNEFLDGKRVYARLYEGTVPITSARQVSTTIIDISNIGLEKVWLDNTNSWYFINNNNSTLSINWYFNSNDWCRTYIYSNNFVQLKVGTNTSSDTFHIIVKYTKATD